ncbi:MAG: hypothetical protein RIM23_20060 [Coleofasciculus sp. G3-WIS-01]
MNAILAFIVPDRWVDAIVFESVIVHKVNSTLLKQNVANLDARK